MSGMSTKNRLGEWDTQQGSAGASSHNPGDAHWSAQMSRDLQNLETVPSPHEDAAIKRAQNTASNNAAHHNLRTKEQEPTVSPQVPFASRMNGQQRKKNRLFNQNTLKQVFTGKNLGKNSSLLTLLLLLFGGGSMFAAFLSPSLAIIQMKEVFTKSLNDQLKVIDERSAVLMRAKLKDVTNGSCGVIKIGCKMKSLPASRIAKFEGKDGSNGIKFNKVPVEEGGVKSGIFRDRYRIKDVTFTDKSGKSTTYDAKNLQRAMIDNVEFRAAMIKGYNPIYEGFKDKVAISVFNRFKVSKRLVTTGANNEERQKNVNAAVGGMEDSGAKTVIRTTDKDGKEVYTDSEGNPLSAAEVESAEQGAERGEGYTKSGGYKSVLAGAVKGVSVVGYMDSACTVFNSLRFVSALAKVKKQAQAARFAMAMVLTPGDYIKSGDASPEDVAFVGDNLTKIQLVSSEKTLDESQLTAPGSAAQPALVDNPDIGKNAFDSPGYHLASYSDTTPPINLRASQYMVGGGSVSLLDGVLGSVATIVNNGDPNPQQVSAKCRYIQNPAVRFTGLAIGIIAGIGSFGLTTAVGIGGSMAIAMALPYIESQGADIIAGNVFKDLSGIDSGDAAYVGTAGLFGAMAMKRGMKPLNKTEGIKQLADTRAAYEKYAETERYLAKSTPFDINNQFSFIGSLASTLTPVLQRSKASASMAMVNVASLIPTAFGSLTKSASAVSTDYFDYCNDQGYKAIGIAAGPFCEVRYGLSDEELAMDPIENVEWMAANGEIDPESEDGAAKDNKQEWNYVKYLEQCPNRTVGWGENQEENQGDGSNCIDPKNEGKNKHYRVYTTDVSVNDSLDGSVDTRSTTSSTAGSGAVSADGWAYPVPLDFAITSNFQSADRPNHKGVDLSTSGATGKSIFAARDGKVVAAGRASGFGNWIVIEHDIYGKKTSTVYGHMYDNGVLVKTGDTVRAGQRIGLVGSNGDSSGPHLHFEVWDGSPIGSGGKPVDPAPMLYNARKAGNAVNV